MTSILLLLGAVLTSAAGEIPVTVEDSGSRDVDAWVRQLVSRRPAPYPSGYHRMFDNMVLARPYRTLEVEKAIEELKRMGPRVFPALVKHLADDRYCYSGVSAAWVNFSVGHAVVNVLSDGHYMHGGYKWRETASGSAGFPSFRDYLNARDPVKWARWASRKTRLEIQENFIDWCIALEEKRGFADETQRKQILGNYQRARERVAKEYAE